MKRFWQQALAVQTQAGWAVHLDGRPMRLPGGTPLCVPSAALAQALADEWQAAGGGNGGEMSYRDTPLTRIAGTAQERVAPDPWPTVAAIARYAETDLLCYRAEHPPALVQRQAREWQKWLDWAALRFDAPLKVTHGIIVVAQDESALMALTNAVASFGPWSVAGLGIAVPVLGSVVLGLALATGEITAPDAFRLSNLDEDFQNQQWGRDDQAAKSAALTESDLIVAARFLDLVRG